VLCNMHLAGSLESMSYVAGRTSNKFTVFMCRYCTLAMLQEVLSPLLVVSSTESLPVCVLFSTNQLPTAKQATVGSYYWSMYLNKKSLYSVDLLISIQQNHCNFLQLKRP
jgi:hypothetical protein